MLKLGLMLVIVGAASALAVGCGSSSSPLQEAEADYREARDQIEKVAGAQQGKWDQAVSAELKAENLFAAQSDAVEAGDRAAARELQTQISATQEQATTLEDEAEAMATTRVLDAAHRLESLKGCAQHCQQQRAEAITENRKCVVVNTRTEDIPAKKAITLCDKWFPVPRPDILQLADE